MKAELSPTGKPTVYVTRRFAKRAVPPATLADKEEWSGMTDVVDGPKK